MSIPYPEDEDGIEEAREAARARLRADISDEEIVNVFGDEADFDYEYDDED
jgi:hypothetical protein